MNPSSFATAPEHRAWNYWFEDGLPALVGGIGCFFYGLFLIFDGPAKLVFIVLAGLILLFNRPILQWFKTRLTYPRTGYATPPYSVQEEPPPVVDLASISLRADPEKLAELASQRHEHTIETLVKLAGILPGTFALIFMNNPWGYTVIAVVIVLFVWFFEHNAPRRPWIVICGIPLIGLYLSIFPPSVSHRSQRAGYFIAACGVLFIVKGAVALARYLSRNPAMTFPAE